jgi:hypothetical protein
MAIAEKPRANASRVIRWVVDERLPPRFGFAIDGQICVCGTSSPNERYTMLRHAAPHVLPVSGSDCLS